MMSVFYNTSITIYSYARNTTILMIIRISPEVTLVPGVHGCTGSTLEGLCKLRGVGDWPQHPDIYGSRDNIAECRQARTMAEQQMYM